MAVHVVNEARRCLHCKDPQCRRGCPIGTPIPQMIEEFLHGGINNAGQMLFKNNPLSVICSLVCDHEKQCEGHCILGRKNAPIHVSSIENYISEAFMDRMNLEKMPPKKMRAAVIGSGPAGITISILLALKGYDITVFDSRDRIGGILRFGIPDFRLPKTLIDKYREKMIALGIKIRLNTTIGGAIGIDDLFRDGYKAVFIGTGVWRPKTLGIKGETLGNVVFALDYLCNPAACPVKDRSIIIIGGGNSAMDVARTAIRQGAKKVTVILRKDHAAASSREIDYAIADGVEFLFCKHPVEITDEGVIFEDLAYGEGDSDPQTVPDSAKLYRADTVVVAVSQGPKNKIVSTTTGIRVNERGLIVATPDGHTTREGIFASGDVVLGAKSVVEAVRDSKTVAESMDAYMRSLTV